MQYLTTDEIPKYCTLQAGVEEADVRIASSLIDGYVGKSFVLQDKTETVKVRKNRGKLNFSPIVNVESVYERIFTGIGLTRTEVPKDKIILDSEMDGYFYYIQTPNPIAYEIMSEFYCQERQRELEVSYKYGYKEVPEDVKQVCAMLAQNIRQQNSFAGIKKLNTLDYTVEMGNPSFFTQDMRLILNKYRG